MSSLVLRAARPQQAQISQLSMYRRAERNLSTKGTMRHAGCVDLPQQVVHSEQAPNGRIVRYPLSHFSQPVPATPARVCGC